MAVLPMGVAALFLAELGITTADPDTFDAAQRQFEEHWAAGRTARSFRYRPPAMDLFAARRALERRRIPP
jgi:hypothetical protein